MGNWRKLETPLKVGVSVMIIGWLVWMADWKMITQAFRDAELGYLAVALLFFLANQYVIAIKLKLIIDIAEQNIHAFDILRANFVGSFLGMALSSSLGTDVVRGFYLYRYGCEKEVVISSMVVDRMLGVITVIVSGGISLFFIPTVHQYPWLIWSYVLFVGVVLGFAFSLNTRLLEVLRKVIGKLKFRWLVLRAGEMLDAYAIFARKRVRLLVPLLLSLLTTVLRIVSVYFITLALGEPLFIGYFFLIIPTVILAAMLPIAVAGIGIREGTMAAMMMLFGMSESMAIATTVVVAIKITVTVVVLGLIFLWATPKGIREQIKKGPLATSAQSPEICSPQGGSSHNTAD